MGTMYKYVKQNKNNKESYSMTYLFYVQGIHMNV